VLRRIFRPEKVAGGCRRLHNEELHDLNTSPNIIRVTNLRKMRWIRHGACMRLMRDAYKTLVGKCEGKKPLQRLRG
jgi:hypothetical protein